MDFQQQHRDFINNRNENNRNRQLVSSIYSLAEKQKESNDILEKQCNVLQERNKMLQEELKSAHKETKKAMIVNIISVSIALASLIATILIAFLLK